MAGSNEVPRTHLEQHCKHWYMDGYGVFGCSVDDVRHDPWHLGAQPHKLLTRDLGDCPGLLAATQAFRWAVVKVDRQMVVPGQQGVVPRGLRLTPSRSSQTARNARGSNLVR